MSRFLSPLLATLLCCLATHGAIAQCYSNSPGAFGVENADDGVDGPVFAAITWDQDGSGPVSVVVAGSFLNAGALPVNGVAVFDGAWHNLGAGFDLPSIPQPDFGVRALAVYDPDGSGPAPARLYAAGHFQSSGGSQVSNIAMWDGTVWQPLGSGVNAEVHALTVWTPPGATNPLLIVGGDFDTAGGQQHLSLASWNGSSWGDVSGGVSGAPAGSYITTSLTTWDPDGSAGSQPTNLVVGGQFRFAGSGVGIVCNGIARFDGSAWHNFGSQGANSAITAMLSYWPGGVPNSGPADLIVAGGFSQIGGQNIPRMARYDGTWHDIGWAGTSSGGVPRGLALWDPDGPGPLTPQVVVVGDGCCMADALGGVIRWDGTNWNSVGNVSDGVAACVVAWDPDGSGNLPAQLLVGGDFDAVGDIAANAVARYDTVNWLHVGGFPRVARVNAFALLGGRLAIGGTFTQGLAGYNVITWDGANVGTLDVGVDSGVRSMIGFSTGISTARQNHLIVGGDFLNAGGAPASHIAQWTESPVFGGASWSAMGSGFNNAVLAIERFNNATYAAGSFTASGATALNRVAQWNGTAWVALGAGLNGNVFALKAFNGALYAGGNFTTANGNVDCGGLARWTGSAWQAVGGHFLGIVNALEVYNNELIIVGQYPGISGSPNVAEYNGTSYSTLGTGGTDAPVYSLSVFNNTLFMGGNFGQAGGVACSGLASWNGSAWSAVRFDEGTAPTSLCGFQTELEVGYGTNLGSSGWERLAIVPCCGSADFNCDGDLGTDADIESFFACLAGTCPPPPCTSNADLNGDGDIGTDADIEAFFSVLAGGSC